MRRFVEPWKSAALSLLVTSSRLHTTGFSLFAQEIQRQSNVLRATSLNSGHDNMKVLSALWRQLTSRERAAYNERAKVALLVRVHDPVKKNNDFNLIMQLFSKEQGLVTVGDEKFTAMIAKTTMRQLSAGHAQKMREKLNVRPVSAPKANALSNARHREFSHASFFCPDMQHFTSFTQMQRAVAPTRRRLFVAVVRTMSRYHVPGYAEKVASERYLSLSKKELSFFNPISDAEMPYFEQFCAHQCAGMNPRRLDIIALFAKYRLLMPPKMDTSQRQQAIYSSLLRCDRSREGLFFRARRNLLRMYEGRSSDCGMYISDKAAGKVAIPPKAYGIKGNIDDVTVSTLLAETRLNQSVYDDILVRADILRPAPMRAVLNVYDMRRASIDCPVAASKGGKAINPKRKITMPSGPLPGTRKATALSRGKKPPPIRAPRSPSRAHRGNVTAKKKKSSSTVLQRGTRQHVTCRKTSMKKRQIRQTWVKRAAHGGAAPNARRKFVRRSREQKTTFSLARSTRRLVQRAKVARVTKSKSKQIAAPTRSQRSKLADGVAVPRSGTQTTNNHVKRMRLVRKPREMKFKRRSPQSNLRAPPSHPAQKRSRSKPISVVHVSPASRSTAQIAIRSRLSKQLSNLL